MRVVQKVSSTSACRKARTSRNSGTPRVDLGYVRVDGEAGLGPAGRRATPGPDRAERIYLDKKVQCHDGPAKAEFRASRSITIGLPDVDTEPLRDPEEVIINREDRRPVVDGETVLTGRAAR